MAENYTMHAGIANCGQTIVKEEGVRALWKGLTPFATHLTLKYALRMGTNATYQSLLRDEVRSTSDCHKLAVSPTTRIQHMTRLSRLLEPYLPMVYQSKVACNYRSLSRTIDPFILNAQEGKLTDGRRLVAGFSAGITEALVIVTPFEVVKIRLQQQKGMARDQLKYRVCDLSFLLPSFNGRFEQRSRECFLAEGSH